MPGKSQLEQFSKDLLSLGDEITLRAARGETPVKVEIPKDVKDENDKDEFFGGMPEIEAEEEAVVQDEDFSDLMGIATPEATSEGGEEAPAPNFAAPDMSSLLDTFETVDMGGGDMPDLSMFNDEPVQEEEEIVEEEPEEISIADMGLDALLSGGGFDEVPEEEKVEEEPVVEEDNNEVVEIEPLDERKKGNLIDDLNDFDDLEEVTDDENLEEVEDAVPLEEDTFNIEDFVTPPDTPKAETSSSDDIFNFDNPSSDSTSPFDLESTPAADTDDSFSLDNLGIDGDATDTKNHDDPFNFDVPTSTEDDFFKEPLDVTPPAEDIEEIPSLDEEVEDIEELPMEDLPSIDEELPVEESTDSPIDDLGSFDDIPEMEEELPSLDEDNNVDTLGDDLDSLPVDDLSSNPSLDKDAPSSMEGDTDFNLDDMDIPVEDFSTEGMDSPESIDTESDNSLGDMGGIDDFNISDLPSFDEKDEAVTDNGFGVDDFALDDEKGSDNTEPAFTDLFNDDIPPTEDNIEDNGNAPEGLFDANDVEFDAKEEIPEFEDYNLDNFGEEPELEGIGDAETEPIEDFDTSDMEGLDFDIPDTDSQLRGADDDSSFDLPHEEGMGFDEGFEIPGFSDVETIKEQKSTSPLLVSSSKNKKTKKKGEDEDENEEELPPNTLSDKQYKTFRKNLSEYPLNVRLAFEDFIVQDEFTPDAEFEVIEKILNKAPARQVASTLEKMLDISIPVPRDFEHRSAEEYEAYKKSISYQLKNKIIPIILVGLLGVLVCIGLFNFGKNCIYKPMKASNLYKQGYVLLQESEYPLSEVKFNEATKYRMNKNWFYKYARGYREHKQYQRAGKMYQNILRCFRHEKAAGLEYADMELNDLANYQRAEEIVRREVLDYHINDEDGLLMLGDIFLEWATEKDPTKFELAREQYATLINLYGATDLYLSRMMRYFIRTDNLREVLQLKQNFEPREKSLCADDWTELSGYLLDKYYGELAPSDEYLRYQIEGLLKLLKRAVDSNPKNPIALYNLGRYFIETNEYEYIESTLQDSIEKFNAAEKMKSRDIYKYIDAYRLLGEFYITKDNFLQAQEQFAEGISLYIAERDNAGFKGNDKIGKLYEDMGDIKYTISGDYNDALVNYNQSVNLGNDSPKIRYRIGYINYNNRDYEQALDSFMKAGDGYIKERNLLLAMANTLSLRGDDYAAEGYYEQLMESLDNDIASEGLLIPQAKPDDFDLVSTYLYGSNNYGVTLHRLAKKTGDSSKNAEAIVQLSESLRAWDALTRNPETMVRLEGSNLAQENIKYITHPTPEFEPEIYTNISKCLLDTEKL